jgi:hypothetical protein
MFRNLLSAFFVILAITAFVPQMIQAQAVIDTGLYAALQANLPAQSANYTPCCNWVHWTFSWTNVYSSQSDATLYARIYGTSVSIYIENGQYGNGEKSQSGDTFTGTGTDALWIDDSGGSNQYRFTAMKWNVHYYDKQDQ